MSEVSGLLDILRTMPVGYDNRDLPTPMRESFGLAQRGRLVSAAETTYRQALERMFRSRLILRLEHQIEAGMNDPLVLYETLKVYLMLGGKSPKIDKDLVEIWMTQGLGGEPLSGADQSQSARRPDPASASHARTWRGLQADVRPQWPTG